MMTRPHPTTYSSLPPQKVKAEAASLAQKVFMLRGLVACSLPLRPLLDREGKKLTRYTRVNGTHQLSLFSDPRWGVPYGKDRLLLFWLFTQAVRTRSRKIPFPSLRKVIGELGFPYSQHHRKWLEGALKRVSSTSLCFTDQRKETSSALDPKDPIVKDYTVVQEGKKERYLVLSQAIFDELQRRALPVPREIVQSLAPCWGSLDLFLWWNWRNQRLKQDRVPSITAPLAQLQGQFGNHAPLASWTFKQTQKRQLARLDQLLEQRYGFKTGLEIQKAYLKISMGPQVGEEPKKLPQKAFQVPPDPVLPSSSRVLEEWSEATQARFEQWRASTPWEAQKKLLSPFLLSRKSPDPDDPSVQGALMASWKQLFSKPQNSPTGTPIPSESRWKAPSQGS